MVPKVNNVDTSGFVLKTKYVIYKSDLEKKISDADKKKTILVDLLKKQIIMLRYLVWRKIPSISGLATTAALITVENKIPDASDFVKKTNYDTKILNIKCKYFTTADCNKLKNEKLDLKMK